jgi:hypothetical protein
MALLLLQLGAHPNEIAATKIDSCIADGAFFLDFSRPLGKQCWCGVWNRWLGLKMALMVPVVHQGEQHGNHVIAVDRGDPYFRELQALWKARYPSTRTPPSAVADGPQVIADFAAQFPADARYVRAT